MAELLTCRDCGNPFTTLVVVGTKPTRCRECQEAKIREGKRRKGKRLRQASQCAYEQRRRPRLPVGRPKAVDRYALTATLPDLTGHDAAIHAFCEDARRQRTACRAGEDW